MKTDFKKRIAYFNTIAVAIAVAVVFIVIFGVVCFSSYQHLDNDIAIEKEEILSQLNCRGDSILLNGLPQWENETHKEIEVNPTFIQIVDKKGNLIFRSSNLQKKHFLFAPKQKEPLFYNTTIENQKIRQGQFPIYNEQKNIVGQLSVGISQQESYYVLHNLGLILGICFPLMLVLVYVVISFSVSKAIAPVYELIRTAANINESNINTRLPLPENQDEIYRLAYTINELLNRIENSIHQQTRFTADASHEMRTPLTAMRGTLEVLLRKKREPEQYEAKIKDVIIQVDRLSLLFDQLLQLARLESGIVIAQKESVDLQAIMVEMGGKWQKQLQEKQLTLHIEIPYNTIIIADEFLMERILENLLSNAIKYSKDNSHIYFTWDDVKKCLLIKDEGIGISASTLPYLFDRFYRSDNSRNSQVQGNGLGLSIVKHLVELQGMGILVRSIEGEGTLFELRVSPDRA